MRLSRALLTFLAACILTPFAVILALALAGAGHGSYFAAKILFPYTMLSTHWLEAITIPFVILALVQFPLYGLFLAFGSRKQHYWSLALLILIVHMLAVALCFVIPMPAFH